MATTYTWVISQLDTAPSDNGLSNVVKTIHWRLQATNDTHTADVYGSLGLDAPDAEDFVSYSSLTKADVEGWLESKLEVDNLKTNLDNQLAALANPPIVNLNLPWA